MLPPAPDTRPIALTIAGSDSGGGAGIQADLATMAAHGAYGTSVVTAVTAQHTRGVERSFPLPVEEVTAQLEAVRSDFEIGAAKTGMLATTEIVEELAARAPTFDFPLVVDPVMVATSGDRLLEPAAERAYEDLVAEATLVTPNADEAAVLTDVAVEDEVSAREAGDELLELGVDAALIKGGHVPGRTITDVLVTPAETVTLEHPRIDTNATHGSGCALAAAIAARLAAGEDLRTAVERGVEFLARAVRYHSDVGHGPGAVNHAVELRDEASKPATADAVRSVAERLVDADISSIVPESGTTVVGATPYAASVDDVAALEASFARTGPDSELCLDGHGHVRFGSSSDGARVVLTARERTLEPGPRFAVGCRHTDAVAAALEDLEWPIVEDGRGDGSGPDHDSTWDEPPVAVIDPEADPEPIVWIVATDPETVTERVLAIATRAREAQQ